MAHKRRTTTIEPYTITTVLITTLYFVVLIGSVSSKRTPINERPTIGIPTMKITDELLLQTVPKLKDREYIASSYVKFIEMAGAEILFGGKPTRCVEII